VVVHVASVVTIASWRQPVEVFRRKTEGQLAAGTYECVKRSTWADFRKQYEATTVATMEPSSRDVVRIALDHFEKIIKPVRVDSIKTETIDKYIAKRRTQRGVKRGSTVSPVTVNKELRTIKAALRKANDWKYLPQVPKFVVLKEPKKLPRYITPEDFAKIYGACDVAVKPRDMPYSPGDWWRALLTFAYMTGWRISEPLALHRDDLELEAGTAITRYGDNKGNRDDVAPLHPVVIEHLRKITSFDASVFPWAQDRRGLWVEFHRIQKAAGIKLTCREDHEHTEACDYYGFHDCRRAFATLNAETLTGDALQALMRHKSYTTTQGYINMSRQLNRSVEGLVVPDVLKAATVG
jgi:integrase